MSNLEGENHMNQMRKKRQNKLFFTLLSLFTALAILGGVAAVSALAEGEEPPVEEENILVEDIPEVPEVVPPQGCGAEGCVTEGCQGECQTPPAAGCGAEGCTTEGCQGECQDSGEAPPAGCTNPDCTVEGCQGECVKSEGEGEEEAPGPVIFTLPALRIEVDAEDYDLMEGVSAVDTEGNELTVTLSDDGGFDVSEPGEYILTYQAEYTELGEDGEAVAATASATRSVEVYAPMMMAPMAFLGNDYQIPNGALFILKDNPLGGFSFETYFSGTEVGVADETGDLNPTLNGITAAGSFTMRLDNTTPYQTAKAISVPGDMTVAGTGYFGIKSGGTPLSVTGTLTVAGGVLKTECDRYNYSEQAVLAGALIMDGGTLQASQPNSPGGNTVAAVRAGSLTLNSGTIAASVVGTHIGASAIRVDGDVTVNGSVGLNLAFTGVAVTIGGNLAGAGTMEIVDNNPGGQRRAVLFTGANPVVSAGLHITGTPYRSIQAENNLTLADGADVRVHNTATITPTALLVNETFTMNGGSFKATASITDVTSTQGIDCRMFVMNGGEITINDSGMAGGFNYGITALNVTGQSMQAEITGGTVNIYRNSTGTMPSTSITARGGLTMSAGTLDIQAAQYGIEVYVQMTMTGGNIKVGVNGTNHAFATTVSGIRGVTSSASVSGGSINIHVVGKDSQQKLGMSWGGSLMVSGGSIDSTAAGAGSTWAVSATGNIDVTAGSLTGTAGPAGYGVFASQNFSATGGTVTGTGDLGIGVGATASAFTVGGNAVVTGIVSADATSTMKTGIYTMASVSVTGGQLKAENSTPAVPGALGIYFGFPATHALNITGGSVSLGTAAGRFTYGVMATTDNGGSQADILVDGSSLEIFAGTEGARANTFTAKNNAVVTVDSAGPIGLVVQNTGSANPTLKVDNASLNATAVYGGATSGAVCVLGNLAVNNGTIDAAITGGTPAGANAAVLVPRGTITLNGAASSVTGTGTSNGNGVHSQSISVNDGAALTGTGLVGVLCDGALDIASGVVKGTIPAGTPTGVAVQCGNSDILIRGTGSKLIAENEDTNAQGTGLLMTNATSSSVRAEAGGQIILGSDSNRFVTALQGGTNTDLVADGANSRIAGYVRGGTALNVTNITATNSGVVWGDSIPANSSGTSIGVVASGNLTATAGGEITGTGRIGVDVTGALTIDGGTLTGILPDTTFGGAGDVAAIRLNSPNVIVTGTGSKMVALNESSTAQGTGILVQGAAVTTVKAEAGGQILAGNATNRFEAAISGGNDLSLIADGTGSRIEGYVGAGTAFKAGSITATNSGAIVGDALGTQPSHYGVHATGTLTVESGGLVQGNGGIGGTGVRSDNAVNTSGGRIIGDGGAYGVDINGSLTATGSAEITGEATGYDGVGVRVTNLSAATGSTVQGTGHTGVYILGGVVNGGTVTGTSNSTTGDQYGIRFHNTLEVKNGGTVNGLAETTSTGSIGVYSASGTALTVSGAGSSLVAEGGFRGIEAKTAAATVENGASLTATAHAQVNVRTYGLYVDNLNITGGATATGTANYGTGVQTRFDINVNGATLNGKGNTGIAVGTLRDAGGPGNLTLTNATVNAELYHPAGATGSTGDSAIYVYGNETPADNAKGNLTVTNSTVTTLHNSSEIGYGINMSGHGQTAKFESSTVVLGSSSKRHTVGLFTRNTNYTQSGGSVTAWGSEGGVRLSNIDSVASPFTVTITGGTLEGNALTSGAGSQGIQMGSSAATVLNTVNISGGAKVTGTAAGTGAGVHAGLLFGQATTNITGAGTEVNGTAGGGKVLRGVHVGGGTLSINNGAVVNGTAQNFAPQDPAHFAKGVEIQNTTAMPTVAGGASLTGTSPDTGIHTNVGLLVTGNGSKALGSAPAGRFGVYSEGDILTAKAGADIKGVGQGYGVYGGAGIQADNAAVTGEVSSDYYATISTAGIMSTFIDASNGATVTGTGNNLANSMGIGAQTDIRAAGNSTKVIGTAANGWGIYVAGGNTAAPGSLTQPLSMNITGAQVTGQGAAGGIYTRAAILAGNGAAITGTGGASTVGIVIDNGGTPGLQMSGAATAVTGKGGQGGVSIATDVVMTGGKLTAEATSATRGFTALYIGGTSVTVENATIEATTVDYDYQGPGAFSAIQAPNVPSGNFKVNAGGHVIENYQRNFHIADVPVDPTDGNPTMDHFKNYDWIVGAPGAVDKNADPAGLLGLDDSNATVSFSAVRTIGSTVQTGEPLVLAGTGKHTVNYGGVVTEAPYYTIFFDSNGGDNQIPTQKVKKGDCAIPPPAGAINREFHYFGGWTLTRDGNDFFDFSVPLTGNVRVYARWYQNFFWVRYVSTLHTDGGVPDGKMWEYNTRYDVLPGLPIRDGYSFTGWLSDYDGKLYYPGDDFIMPDTNVTLYATWDGVPEPPVPPVSGIITSVPVTSEPEPDESTPESELPPPPESSEIPVSASDGETPGGTIARWSLLNLILAVLGAIGSVVLLVLGIKQAMSNKRQDEDAEEDGESAETTGKASTSSIVWRILAVLTGVLMPIFFAIVEDMRNQMTFVNQWTLPMILLACLQLLFVLILRRSNMQQDEVVEETAGDDEI